MHPLPAPDGIAPTTWRFTSLSRFEPETLESVLSARLGRSIALDREALRAAERDDLDHWQSFGANLYRDADAVRAGLPAWREALERSG